MERNKLREKLKDKSSFVVYVELTGGPKLNFGPIENFLKAYRAVDGLVQPQNPGGWVNIKPADVNSQLKLRGLLGGLDVLPHITCKDHNAFGILSVLVGYRNAGIESILVMTGDNPVEARGVFELDSIGLLQTVRGMNNESYIWMNAISMCRL